MLVVSRPVIAIAVMEAKHAGCIMTGIKADCLHHKLGEPLWQTQLHCPVWGLKNC